MLVSAYGVLNNLTVDNNLLSAIFSTAEGMITGRTKNYLGIDGTMLNISTGVKTSLIFKFKKN